MLLDGTLEKKNKQEWSIPRLQKSQSGYFNFTWFTLELLAVTKSQSYKRCLTSDVCRPVVPNVICNTNVQCTLVKPVFYSTSSLPMSDFHSCFFRNCQKLKQQDFLCIFGQILLYLKSTGSHRQMTINLSENFCVHSVGHMLLQKKS